MKMNVGSAAFPTVTVLDAANPTLVTADNDPDVPTNDPADNPPVFRNDDAPVPELLSTEAEPEAVWNDPANRPALLITPNARVPELLSTEAEPEAVRNDPASSPPELIAPKAAVPELASTPEEPVAAVIRDTAAVVDAVRNGNCIHASVLNAVEEAWDEVVDEPKLFNHPTFPALAVDKPATDITLFAAADIALDSITLATVGVAVNTVAALPVEAVCAEAANNPLDDNIATTVGAALKAVIAAAVDAVSTDPANRPLDDITATTVGAALKTVTAADALDVNAEAATNPPDDIAPSVADVTAVTKPSVLVDCALAPYHETVHVLLAWENARMWPMTYSPAGTRLLANVIG